MANEEVIVEAKGQDNTIIIEKNSNHEVILNLERYYFCELEKIFKSQDFIDNLLTMQEWITLNYPNMASYGKANKCQLACQRLINYAVLKNLKEITGVYNSAISSDIAFETNNAIVNIDSKTVSSTGNKNDFESLFFGPNQSSFKNKNIGVSRNNNYPGLPVNFQMPSIDILNKKPVLTFFLMLKYTDNGEKFDWYSHKGKPNARFICIPNGELSYLFKNEIISNVKTYEYGTELNKNNKKVAKTLPLSKDLNDENFIPIKVKTKKGFYNLSTKETWLETDIKGGKIYKQAISTHSCRIDFFTLKDRYDSNQTYWKGVSSWNIFDQDLSN